MGREEWTIAGVVSLFFGITWLAYAALQPLVPYSGGGACYNGSAPPVPNMPPCFSLSNAAEVFYTLGGIAVVLGVFLLVVRLSITLVERKSKQIKPDFVIQ